MNTRPAESQLRFYLCRKWYNGAAPGSGPPLSDLWPEEAGVTDVIGVKESILPGGSPYIIHPDGKFLLRKSLRVREPAFQAGPGLGTHSSPEQ